MAEELPIKYVKDKDGKFVPITSPKAVIDENGKSIDEVFAKEKDLPINYVTTNTYQTITSDKSFQNGFSLADKTTGFSIWNIGLDNYTNIEIKNGANLIEGANIIFKLNQDGTITVTNVTTGTTKTFATLNDIPNLSNYYTKSEVLNALYPIGTIYLSTSTNGLGSSSPASWLGGTWERITDRFLIGAGGSYALGATGGSATHTLTVNEMPSHTHTIQVAKHTASGGMGTGKRVTDGLGERITDATGGGQAHNNMPPYLAVYMWKRIS